MYRLFFMLLIASLAACQPGNKEPEDTQSPAAGQAAALYRQALQLDQQADSLWTEGEDVPAEIPNEQALAAFSRLITLDPNYRRAAAPYLGKAYFRKKDFQKATQWLSEAVEAEPGNAQLYNLLAFSQLNTGMVDSAKTNMAHSIELRDTEENRQYIVDNLIKIGQTAFEYGVEYESKAEFVTARDYKNYGILVLTLAYDLHGSDEKIARQIIAYAELVGDQELANRYRKLLK